jgi:transcriptional regulator with XRE-family HTH domain
MSQNLEKTTVGSISYRIDLINGAMGTQRLTNEELAKKARVATKTVSAIRNGDPKVGLPTLKAVLDALGLTLHEVFEPKTDDQEAAA